jgi:beta-aspartyl-peptidase (threonine type)
MSKIALAIHGGAGTISKLKMTPALESEYRGGLENALRAAWDVLYRGGGALDAVEAAVSWLEDFPLFNAGRGSVFTHEGRVEMDASIMDGRTLEAGAVAAVCNVQNPIRLARLVMERTEHVLLSGEGANQFAQQTGVNMQPDEYFFTEHRWRQLLEAREVDKIQLDHSDSFDRTNIIAGTIGTVGAVACDKRGDLAAATSTGGMTNKKFGRIGDTSLIGAGNYADRSCAVSCTGHGEFFMRGVTAYDVAARIKYKDQGLAEAAQASIDFLTEIGGEGGLIAVDSSGNVALPFNSEGMYRGYATEEDGIKTHIFR